MPAVAKSSVWKEPSASWLSLPYSRKYRQTLFLLIEFHTYTSLSSTTALITRIESCLTILIHPFHMRSFLSITCTTCPLLSSCHYLSLNHQTVLKRYQSDAIVTKLTRFTHKQKYLRCEFFRQDCQTDSFLVSILAQISKISFTSNLFSFVR